MKHCTKFEELISAYVDEELDSSEKLFLEEHFRECRNCLNLLALYHGMSVSLRESCAEAPPSLRDNVMNIINNPESDRIVTPSIPDEIDLEFEARMKRRKLRRTILTRYAPIAACLAIALLVLPQFFNIDRSSYQEAVPIAEIAPSAFPEMAYDDTGEAVPFGAVDLEVAAEEALDNDFIAPDAIQAAPEETPAGASQPTEADGGHIEPRAPFEDSDAQRQGGGGWTMNDSLLEPEYVATAGYYAFIMIEHELTESFQLVPVYGDYHMIEKLNVASFIEQYGDYVVFFIEGDEAAEFALIQFVW